MGSFVRHIHKYINLKFGLAGAFLMGGIVFFINLDHGWKLAAIAGAKQWAYTFFFGGIIIKLLEILLGRTRQLKNSIGISVLLISTLTSMLVFVVHNLRGTPEPLLSTLPTVILSPPGFYYIANNFRKAETLILKEKQDKAL